MKNRVVITGLGVCSPIGVTIPEFTQALKNGESGIRFRPDLEELKFSCQLGAIPQISEEKKREYLTELQLRNFMSSGILYGIIAGMDAFKDAKLELAKNDEDPLWDLGIIFGTGVSSVEKMHESLMKIHSKNVRRLSSNTIPQIMVSGVSAYLSGFIGAGNVVTSNSSACSTGTEALLMGYERIKNGQAKQMLCGSCSDHGPYIWGGFDAIRVTTHKYNDAPENVAGPMSAVTSGFVPGSGGGAYLLESLESAQKRGAIIYAEVLGGALNNGGQRGDGSMTAPNNIAVQKCIEMAVEDSNVSASEIDYINGHLTSTIKDPDEIANWSKALKRSGSDFPYINSLKGMIGHCIAASGSIEIVASLLQLQQGFIFPNINCNPIHPDILNTISEEKIPTKTIYKPINTIAKASFGFGDVNACVIFKKY
ncbi:3-oxoacyl-(acyl-carrier-protein) synthase [Aequorivita sublithincola DSM 14238]|uniref:3-oxoacyl-[acyl-carrier-protein] synthase 1 n=1 Tax=Aequorivita sublithincola (strain DSM 14238 / LMG 21431 / ACAM 643 / 9-3) TaxID=746697 RepID=I3YYU2_AEQSU|nr:beta-ketoacyl-[acyl-carrier-protein] synthase family protein [Aequorivita sublithincola]AFL82160.1 3-oxoacyl-(acyl-carrier-protein) synthase [Aequorivita sublithincola DSM 14238]